MPYTSNESEKAAGVEQWLTPQVESYAAADLTQNGGVVFPDFTGFPNDCS